MNTLNVIALILVILIVLVMLTTILFKYHAEKLNNIKDLLDDSEKECIDELKRKNEIISKMIKVATSKFKCESTAFDEVKDLEIDNLDSFKDEKKLIKCYEELVHVIEDNPKSKDLKTLSTSNNLEEDFYKIIVPKFKFASYMPKGNYDKQFAVVGVSFNDVLKDSFGSVEQGKTFLHNFYNRRNQIAYLLDRPNFKAPQNPIDVDYVNFCIDHISNLSDSIFSSVAALIGNS